MAQVESVIFTHLTLTYNSKWVIINLKTIIYDMFIYSYI